MCAATKEIPLQPALLKIDGTDARSLAEIKRMRICDTLRTVFSSGMDAACDNQKRCFGSAETRSQNYTRMYSFGADVPYIFKRPI